MKVIKTNIKAETVEINPREALRNTFQTIDVLITIIYASMPNR